MFAVYQDAVFGAERGDPHVRRVVLSIHRTRKVAELRGGKVAKLLPKGEKPGWQPGDTPYNHYWADLAYGGISPEQVITVGKED